MHTGIAIMVLDKSVGAFHGYLSEAPIFVEHIEDVAFSDLFCKQVPWHYGEYAIGKSGYRGKIRTYKKSRSLWKSVPGTFSNVYRLVP